MQWVYCLDSPRLRNQVASRDEFNTNRMEAKRLVTAWIDVYVVLMKLLVLIEWPISPFRVCQVRIRSSPKIH